MIANEYDNEEKERLTDIWGSDPDYWKEEQEKILNQLFNEAINNYKSILNGK